MNRALVFIALAVPVLAASWWFNRPGESVAPLPLVQSIPGSSATQVSPGELPVLSPYAVIRDELKHTNRIVSAITRKPVRFFRPPGGRYSSQVLQIARSLGMTTAFWTDDPGDFNNPGEVTLEKRTLH